MEGNQCLRKKFCFFDMYEIRSSGKTQDVETSTHDNYTQCIITTHIIITHIIHKNYTSYKDDLQNTHMFMHVEVGLISLTGIAASTRHDAFSDYGQCIPV
jgi:hypothetical protein